MMADNSGIVVNKIVHTINLVWANDHPDEFVQTLGTIMAEVIDAGMQVKMHHSDLETHVVCYNENADEGILEL